MCKNLYALCITPPPRPLSFHCALHPCWLGQNCWNDHAHSHLSRFFPRPPPSLVVLDLVVVVSVSDAFCLTASAVAPAVMVTRVGLSRVLVVAVSTDGGIFVVVLAFVVVALVDVFVVVVDFFVDLLVDFFIFFVVAFALSLS